MLTFFQQQWLGWCRLKTKTRVAWNIYAKMKSALFFSGKTLFGLFFIRGHCCVAIFCSQWRNDGHNLVNPVEKTVKYISYTSYEVISVKCDRSRHPFCMVISWGKLFFTCSLQKPTPQAIYYRSFNVLSPNTRLSFLLVTCRYSPARCSF